MSVVLAGFLMIWLLVYAWGAARWALKDVDRLFDRLETDREAVRDPNWCRLWRRSAACRTPINFHEAMIELGRGRSVARRWWPEGERLSTPRGDQIFPVWRGTSQGIWSWEPSAADYGADDWYVVSPEMIILEDDR